MKAHQSAIGKNDEWLTPKWIFEGLGEFDLDPCSPVKRPWDTAKRHYTVNDDGLKKEWSGRVWLNPPFNRYERHLWMKKMGEHGNGIMLIPAAMETKSWHDWVWPYLSGVLILNKRPHFCFVDGTEAKANSGCTIALVAFGEENFKALLNSKNGICLVKL